MSDLPSACNLNKIKLNLSHSDLDLKVSEVRFDLSESIANIKKICERKFGTKPEAMQLILQDQNGNSVASLNEDDRTLEYYCPHQLYNIHVIELDPNSITKELNDVTQVEKYTISEEEYKNRPNTVRKFKENYLKKGAGPLDEDKDDDNHMAEEAKSFAIGKRCKLFDQGHLGTIEYIGQVPEINKGWFVGIKLDMPVGKNDGSLQGTKYFNCEPNFGLFVRPNKILVGNFLESTTNHANDDDEI